MLIVQFDLDDGDRHAILFFDEQQPFGDRKIPSVEMIAAFADLRQRFEGDRSG